jgi:hypothetical protein
VKDYINPLHFPFLGFLKTKVHPFICSRIASQVNQINQLRRTYPAPTQDPNSTMAAPAEVTLKDLSGQWVMVSNSLARPHLWAYRLIRLTYLQNKTLSDDPDDVLALQGMGWMTRKAISIATVTLHTKQYTDDVRNQSQSSHLPPYSLKER